MSGDRHGADCGGEEQQYIQQGLMHGANGTAPRTNCGRPSHGIGGGAARPPPISIEPVLLLWVYRDNIGKPDRSGGSANERAANPIGELDR